MENKHSSDGIAEDIIRSFTQLTCSEGHYKTLIEKRLSEFENGMVKENEITKTRNEIEEMKQELSDCAQIRREEMLYLYTLYGGKGNKNYWCLVKHLSLGMYTAFEAWQASDDDPDLLYFYKLINQRFIHVLTKFLGITVTECASCFGDILKAELESEDENGTSDL